MGPSVSTGLYRVNDGWIYCAGHLTHGEDKMNIDITSVLYLENLFCGFVICYFWIWLDFRGYGKNLAYIDLQFHMF